MTPTGVEKRIWHNRMGMAIVFKVFAGSVEHWQPCVVSDLYSEVENSVGLEEAWGLWLSSVRLPVACFGGCIFQKISHSKGGLSSETVLLLKLTFLREPFLRED